MQHGGVSSNSIKSNFKSSKEILTAFKDNDLYSNQFLIFLRFPIKLIQFILKKWCQNDIVEFTPFPYE